MLNSWAKLQLYIGNRSFCGMTSMYRKLAGSLVNIVWFVGQRLAVGASGGEHCPCEDAGTPGNSE